MHEPSLSSLDTSVRALQTEVANQKKDINRLMAQITAKDINQGTTSHSFSENDLQKQLLSEESDAFTKTSFWATTNLTWFAFLATFIITVASIILAIFPLIKVEEKARRIAKEEVDELNNILAGRLQLAIGVVLRKITWDKKYQKISTVYDFSEDAVASGERAWESCQKIKWKDYEYLKGFALNNLLFYMTLTKESEKHNETTAMSVLTLAAKLKKEKDFQTDADYINTYSLALLTFYTFLGDRTNSSILERLGAIEKLLYSNIGEDREPSPRIYSETNLLLRKLDRIRTTIEEEEMRLRNT